MLRRHAVFVTLFRLIADILITACLWNYVFYLRFTSGMFASPKGIPDFKYHLMLTLPVVLICCFSCFLFSLCNNGIRRRLYHFSNFGHWFFFLSVIQSELDGIYSAKHYAYFRVLDGYDLADPLAR